jgi:uncharacterized cupredoxin-like copper-binding protein
VNPRVAQATLVAVALAIAGCAGDETSDAPVTTIVVTGADALTFDPDEFTVLAGQAISVEFTAEPAVEHDLVIEGAADHGSTGEAGHGAHVADGHATADGDLHVAHADAGTTTHASFTIDTPGTYEMYCSVPGHRQSGMTATLSVLGS